MTAALADYPGPAGAMSFSSAMGGWLRRRAPAMRRGLIFKGRESLFARWYAMRLVMPDFIALNVHSLGMAWAGELRATVPLYAWTVNNPTLREYAAELADAAIWEADGRP